MPSEVEQGILEQIRCDGLVGSGNVTMVPFGGGVSSDVWLVEEEGSEPFVVKRSVAKLRVKAEWFADPARLLYEYRYLEIAAKIAPGAVPKLLSKDPHAPFVAMEYLGAGFENWKARLLAGDIRIEDARRAGETLGLIHRATRNDPEVASQFDTLPFFRQLRIEPYLLATAEKHPALAGAIEAEAARLATMRECLVHGDYSPKNMLVSDGRFAVLDCETAWFGDPAFDLAFVLNHLHLKALLHSPKLTDLSSLIEVLSASYFQITGADKARDRRTARLVLMLLLARVDGKSPAEYLDPARQDRLRSFVGPRLNDWDGTLADLSAQWFQFL